MQWNAVLNTFVVAPRSAVERHRNPKDGCKDQGFLPACVVPLLLLVLLLLLLRGSRGRLLRALRAALAGRTHLPALPPAAMGADV